MAFCILNFLTFGITFVYICNTVNTTNRSPKFLTLFTPTIVTLSPFNIFISRAFGSASISKFYTIKRAYLIVLFFGNIFASTKARAISVTVVIAKSKTRVSISYLISPTYFIMRFWTHARFFSRCVKCSTLIKLFENEKNLEKD